MKNINNKFMIRLMKNLLYIKIDQHISLRILRPTVVMTNDYLKCCNVSLLIYRGFKQVYFNSSKETPYPWLTIKH